MVSRRQLHALLALVVIAAPLGACSALVAFSGLVGDAPGPVDGEADSLVDSTTSTDGAAADAGAVVDATTLPVRFCADAQGASFCDDFDEPDGGFSRWSSTHVGMGTLTVDLDASVSPPASLLATCVGGGMFNGVSLTENLSGHTRARLSADVRLDAFDKIGYGSILEIHLLPLPSGFGDYRVALIYTAGLMTLDVYSENNEGGSVQNATPIALDFSAWQHISIEIAMTPTPHAAAFDANGTQLGNLAMPAFAGSDTNQGQSATVGLPYLVSNTQPWGVRLDNVTVAVSD